MKAKHLLPILSSAFLWSCNEAKVETPSPISPAVELHGSAGADAKISFAKVLAKAVNNPSVRKLLTDKAELQFDKDYDVLYQQIKNEVVDGRTLDNYIKELSSASDYSLFNRSPLLTVYLPHGHQAATASVEVPWIAVRDHQDNLVAYNATGDIKELDANTLPLFPVMVVKENERVVYENAAKKESRKGHLLFESDGNQYFFSDNEFDGVTVASAKDKSQARQIPVASVDPEVQTAFNNAQNCNTCPQRDWIYYGIYPAGGANQGSMNIKYSEAITSVQFESPNVFYTLGGWDEGNYELYVSIFFSGASSTGVFSSVLKVLSLGRDDMFQFDSNNKPISNYYYNMPNFITIVPWDMQAYGNRWAFKVEEYDPEVKKTATYGHSSTYGTNFKVDASGTIAKIVKLGAEFGTTSTTQNSTNFTYETTDANDILGGAILTWTDPVMVSRRFKFPSSNIAEMGTITTGTTRIGVESVRTTP